MNHVYVERIYIFKLTLSMLGNFSCLLTFKKSLPGTLSECQTVWIHSVSPMGPNCLQRLSADDKSRC